MEEKIKLSRVQNLHRTKQLTLIVFMTIIAFIINIAFVGCGGSKTFTDVMQVEDYLAGQEGGTSPEYPITFSVNIDFQNMASPESNWHKLLTSINKAGLYVAIDFSGSTMINTVFDADGGIQIGKNFIVSLVLPDSTENVKGVLYGYFGNLKTARSKKINSFKNGYLIGDRGPAGGIIIYDKGYSKNGWRYLEAAPANSEFSAEWGAYGYELSGIEESTGTGKQNTEIILKYLRIIGETGKAAQICSEMSINGFTDWFLPSLDELGLMYHDLHKKNLGGFDNVGYWSSSQQSWNTYNNKNNALVQYFASGHRTGIEKTSMFRVRAVRSF